jgi:ATP-dependent DNA helicase RecQ
MRKNIAEEKLSGMIDYSNSSKCRLAVILEYFGQIENDFRCGKCDNCTGKNIEITSSLNYLQEILVQTVHESKGRVRKSELAKIVKGTSVKNYARDFTTFGSCALYEIRDIEESVDKLMKEEKIFIDSTFVYLTEIGKEFLVEPAADIEEKPGYEKRLELFNKLRQSRKEAASKFNQTAQLICSDELLRKIAEAKPKNTSELLSIDGFSRRAYNKVGEDFLEVIKEFSRTGVINSESRTSALPKDIASTYELVQKGYSLTDIASLMNLPESIVSIQIETIIEYMPELNIEKLIEQKEVELISAEIKKGNRNLKEIKKLLPSNISYAKIRVVLSKSLS